MSNTVFVKIIKASKSSYWYAVKIGEVFEVKIDETWYSINTAVGVVSHIEFDDCVVLTTREVIEYKISKVKEEIKDNEKELVSLETELKNLDNITVDDIVTGAKFCSRFNDSSVFYIVKTYDGQYVLSGLYGDPFRLYRMEPITSRTKMAEYMTALDVKKVNE